MAVTTCAFCGALVEPESAACSACGAGIALAQPAVVVPKRADASSDKLNRVVEALVKRGWQPHHASQTSSSITLTHGGDWITLMRGMNGKVEQRGIVSIDLSSLLTSAPPAPTPRSSPSSSRVGRKELGIAAGCLGFMALIALGNHGVFRTAPVSTSPQAPRTIQPARAGQDDDQWDSLSKQVEDAGKTPITNDRDNANYVMAALARITAACHQAAGLAAPGSSEAQNDRNYMRGYCGSDLP